MQQGQVLLHSRERGGVEEGRMGVGSGRVERGEEEVVVVMVVETIMDMGMDMGDIVETGMERRRKERGGGSGGQAEHPLLDPAETVGRERRRMGKSRMGKGRRLMCSLGGPRTRLYASLYPSGSRARRECSIYKPSTRLG